MVSEILLSIIKVIGKIRTPFAFLITILILISISWLADGFAEIIQSEVFSKIYKTSPFPIPIIFTIIYITFPIFLSIAVVELIFLTIRILLYSVKKREFKPESALYFLVFFILIIAIFIYPIVLSNFPTLMNLAINLLKFLESIINQLPESLMPLKIYIKLNLETMKESLILTKEDYISGAFKAFFGLTNFYMGWKLIKDFVTKTKYSVRSINIQEYKPKALIIFLSNIGNIQDIEGISSQS